MRPESQFRLWPFLDRDINRGIGRAGVIFTATVCVLMCALGYYFIRPWSVLREEDLRLLGYLGFVVIPLAAWLLGGLAGIQLFMAFQVWWWFRRKEVQATGLARSWIGIGVSLMGAGATAAFLVAPFEYGFVVACAGGVIVFRSTAAIWAGRTFHGITLFPP